MTVNLLIATPVAGGVVTTHYAYSLVRLVGALQGRRGVTLRQSFIDSGLVGHARNTVGFVGYCDPDTPGGQLLAAKPGDQFLFKTANVKAKIKARIERFELSGHADREELLEFAVQTEARSIVLTHGDPPARDWFARQLAEQAPNSKVLDPVPLTPYQV